MTMPNIKHVDIGPCWARFGTKDAEADLGWTQGGVKVNFATESTEVEADQETEPLMTNITKRPISITVPALEHTLEMLAMALPGSTLYYNAAKLTTNLAGETNDLIFTAKTGGKNIGAGNDVAIEYVNPGALQAACAVSVEDRVITVILKHDGTSITATAADVKAAIEADDDAKAIVTVAFIVEETGTGVVSAMEKTLLTGGKQKLVVKSAANQDMTQFAGSLILHPSKKIAGDKSMDMWFPRAVPIGSFEVGYDKENPKVVNLEFKVFPDNDGKTVVIGDPTTTEE